jgi:hypothetical protein
MTDAEIVFFFLGGLVGAMVMSLWYDLIVLKRIDKKLTNVRKG